jgi:RHS repeat-associated protein
VNQVWDAAGRAKESYVYDTNGNMRSSTSYNTAGTVVGGRQVDFDLLDRAVRLCAGAATQCTGTPAVPVTEFAYAPDGARYRQVLSGAPGTGFGPRTVYYLDKDYELTVWNTGWSWPGKMEERSFISGSVVTTQAKVGGTVSPREVRFQHLDRLGSVEAVTLDGITALLNSADMHGFDPWGKPRAGDWSGSSERLHAGGELGATSDRGFTGHEQLDPFYLIHMNGRVYDPRLGRFLSVDPIISNPASSQSINPYSYIGNNPLSGTDPTGYETRSICEGMGRSGNCSTGLDPNGVVGIKLTVTMKYSDGTTTTYSWVQMFSNGARRDNGNNTAVSDHGGPGDTNKGWSTEGRDAEARRWLDGLETAKVKFADSVPPCDFECGRNVARGLMVAGFFWTPAFIAGAALEYRLTGDGTALVLAAAIPVGGKILEGLGTVARGAASATPKVVDAKLGNIVSDLYKGARGSYPIGTGSTADAIRNEVATGLATGGRFHSQKGTEYIRALENWLARNPNASHYDRMVAESLKNDLRNALGK